MEKKDPKKLTKGQLIKLLLKKVSNHEDLLDNDPFKDEVDHWSVAVLTVTVHSSFFPTFDFFKNMLFSALDAIC